MPMLRDLLTDNVKDPPVRQALRWIQDYINNVQFLRADMAFYELQFNRAETALKVPHGLPFIPVDVIQTYISGAGAVTFLYDQFDGTNFVITTTGACKVRFLAGKLQ